MKRSFLAPVLAVLALALSLGVWFTSCEKQTRSVYTGLQGEARANPYLAAQRLLEAMGRDVHAIDGVDALDPLPAPNSTLIVPVDRTVLPAERSLQLREWAERGGHLVVVTWSLWDDEERTPDPVVDPLGIEQYMWPPEGRGGDLDSEAPPELAALAVSGRVKPLRIAFDPQYYLLQAEGSPEAQLVAGDANGMHLLTVRAGAGRVTVLTDDAFLSNTDIGSHDHAELVWRLARLEGRAGSVWMVWNTRYPGAWELLLENAWMVLVSLATALAAWLWWRAPRFGPIRPDPPPHRRRLMEHIEAAGRFGLRDGAERALVEAVRTALRERIAARHPGWLGLVPAELHARLAETTGVERKRIDSALSYREERGEERFARRITTLESIRKGL